MGLKSLDYQKPYVIIVGLCPVFLRHEGRNKVYPHVLSKRSWVKTKENRDEKESHYADEHQRKADSRIS